MSTVEKYASKDDIVYFVKLYNTGFDDEVVDDRLLKMVNAKIDGWIIEKSVNPRNKSDSLNLLWSAVICFALELLCYAGHLDWKTGDIALQKLNRVTYGYQRWQPMFFFATGASDPFKGLLPHETYRMMAYAYVDAYCRDDFFREYGSVYPIPRISKDNTSRGWTWNIDETMIELADAQSLGDEANFEGFYEVDFEDWD